MDGKFFNIKSRTEESAVIEIDGTIGGWDWDDWSRVNTGKIIRRQLAEIGNVKNIEVRITSLGGDVDQALQIHDALVQHPATVTTEITGFCASAATVIALAGDVRKISRNALYLIHKCSSSVAGNQHALEMELESQKTVNDLLFALYEDKCKKSKDDLTALFDYDNGKGRWLAAQEAVDWGFCTELTNGTAAGSVKVAQAEMDMLNYPLMPGYAAATASTEERELNIIQRVIEKARELFAPICPDTATCTTNNHTDNMTKLTEKYAALASVLKRTDDLIDESAGLMMSCEDLTAVEAALAAADAAVSELETLKAEHSALLKEHEELKKKWATAPAPVAAVNGGDNDPGGSVLNDAYYSAIENELKYM